MEYTIGSKSEMFFVAFINSKRHNKLLFSVFAKTIYESFCKPEMAISNVVNYRKACGFLQGGI